MKSHRKELWFNLPTRRGFVNITPQVEEALHESGIREGLCLVSTYPLTIGAFSDGTDGFLGRIDEVAFYKRVLTPAERTWLEARTSNLNILRRRCNIVRRSC